VFDPAANAWTLLARGPFASEPLDLAVVDGRLFVVGAGAFTAVGTRSLHEYDFAADRWVVRRDMPAASAHTVHPSCAVLGGRIFTFGGGFRQGGGWRWSDRAQRYDPASDSWDELPPLSEARLYMPAVALSDRIYVIGGETTDDTGPIRALRTYSANVDTYRLASAARE
jgi:N-acetylneuraminic acid mutarotase